jgi:hypothetical protein
LKNLLKSLLTKILPLSQLQLLFGFQRPASRPNKLGVATRRTTYSNQFRMSITFFAAPKFLRPAKQDVSQKGLGF